MPDDNDPEQEALFEIEGPDEVECVWLVSGSGPEAMVVDLGPQPKVAEKVADWLAQIDFGERP